jgi:hypothetical protein
VGSGSASASASSLSINRFRGCVVCPCICFSQGIFHLVLPDALTDGIRDGGSLSINRFRGALSLCRPLSSSAPESLTNGFGAVAASASTASHRSLLWPCLLFYQGTFHLVQHLAFAFCPMSQHREHWDISEEWTNNRSSCPGCHHVCPSPSPGHCHLLHLALAFCPMSNIGNTGISFRNRLTSVHIVPTVIIFSSLM